MKSSLTHGSERIVQVEMQNKEKWSEDTQSHRRRQLVGHLHCSYCQHQTAILYISSLIEITEFPDKVTHNRLGTYFLAIIPKLIQDKKSTFLISYGGEKVHFMYFQQIFMSETEYCKWMRNTHIHLQIQILHISSNF